MPAAKGAGKGKGKSTDAGKKKGAQPVVPTRIANASQLRNEFRAVNNSPDGVDPQPLSVPKCVECGHCGWPCYPRDSRVATRKTFEKAGITRDYGDKIKETKKDAAAAPGEDGAAPEEEGLDIGDEEDDDEDDANSVGTVEALESKLQDLEEKLMEVESNCAALEREAAELRQQVEDLDEALSAAEEKIELLEESEMRWREKNSVLRVENEDLRLYINRLGNRIGDLETDMVKKLLEIKWRKEEAARKERRRALMLAELEKKIKFLEGAGLTQAIFKVWQGEVLKQNRRRETQEAEEIRRIQVYELKQQLGQEKQHILSLEATTQRLRSSLKAAAHRMLLKVFSTSQKPWATGHALTAWVGAHPALKLQNECDLLQEQLTEIETKLEESEVLATQLASDLGETKSSLVSVTDERDKLALNYAAMMTELQGVLGKQGKQAADLQRAMEEKAKAAREAIINEVWAEANELAAKVKKAFDAEKLGLEDQIGGLEAQLESIKRGLSGGDEGGEETRVVPKGQGVLCCACLRQIVNRGMKQLPPVTLPQSPSKAKLEEQAKKTFFEQELQGMPDPDDLLHSEVWRKRRDPMAGLRYADVSPPSWDKPTQSSSMKHLTPLRIKENLKFKTIFR